MNGLMGVSCAGTKSKNLQKMVWCRGLWTPSTVRHSNDGLLMVSVDPRYIFYFSMSRSNRPLQSIDLRTINEVSQSKLPTTQPDPSVNIKGLNVSNSFPHSISFKFPSITFFLPLFPSYFTKIQPLQIPNNSPNKKPSIPKQFLPQILYFPIGS